MDETEAEDVAQDTMLKLWTMREELDKYRSVEALAVKMARHMCISIIRRSHTVPIDNVHMREDSSPLPDEQLESNDSEAWLDEIIAGLPAAEYRILHLRQVEHMSNGKIADILGIETTSVATILSRARHRLLDAIRQRNK